jgi:hypothetical protein
VTVYRRLAICAMLAASVALSSTLNVAAHPQKHDDKPPGALDQTTISGSAFNGASGSIKVNETAGNGNQQANIFVLSNGNTNVYLHQSNAADTLESGSVLIRGAFAGSTGAIQVNQSAGAGNAQGNVVVVQLGTGLSNSDLSQVVSSPQNDQPNNNSAAGNTATISHGAFNGSSGVVQINQTAGSSNHTVNSFSLQLQTAGPGI